MLSFMAAEHTRYLPYLKLPLTLALFALLLLSAGDSANRPSEGAQAAALLPQSARSDRHLSAAHQFKFVAPLRIH